MSTEVKPTRAQFIGEAVATHYSDRRRDHDYCICGKSLPGAEALEEHLAAVESAAAGAATAWQDAGLLAPDSDPDASVWRVSVDVPASLPAELKESLFTAVADAVHGWEPDNRDGWDASVSASPATAST